MKIMVSNTIRNMMLKEMKSELQYQEMKLVNNMEEKQ